MICGRWYRGAPVRESKVGRAVERAGIASSFQQADRETKSRSFRLDARLLLRGRRGHGGDKPMEGV